MTKIISTISRHRAKILAVFAGVLLLFTTVDTGIFTHKDAKSAQAQKLNIPKWIVDKKDFLSYPIQKFIMAQTGDMKVHGIDLSKAIAKAKEAGIDINLDNGLRPTVPTPNNFPTTTSEPIAQQPIENVATATTTTTTTSPSTLAITTAFSNGPVAVLKGEFNDITIDEPSIAVKPTDSTKMVAGMHHFGFDWPFFQCVAYFSTSSGSTWIGPVLLTPLAAGDFCSDPVLSWSSDGSTAYYEVIDIDSSFTFSTIVVYTSATGGATWSAPVTVFPGVAGVNFNDKPWIAADKDPLGAGTVYATDTLFDATGCHIQFGKSITSGATWSAPITLASADCGTIPFPAPFAGEVVQGSGISADAGLLLVAWYDSNVAPGSFDGFLNGPFSIHAVKSPDKGVTFTPLTIYKSPIKAELPFLMCPVFELNQRIWSSMFPRVDVLTIGGVPHAAVAFSANTLGQVGQDCADVYVAYSNDATFATITLDDVTPVGNAPQVFPGVAWQSDGTIHVMWEDHRGSLALFDPKVQGTLNFFSTFFSTGQPWPNMAYRIMYRAIDSPTNTLSVERVTETAFSSNSFLFQGDYNDAKMVGTSFIYIYTDHRACDGTTDLFCEFTPTNVFVVKGTA